MTHNLSSPISEEAIRELKVGDQVLISGTVFTGRDAVHKYLHDGGELPDGVNLDGGILYHCGPVVLKDDNGEWKVTAAGPTTSIREEPYQGDIMKQFGIRGVIGKGGMADKTLAACKEHGAVSARHRRCGAGVGRVHHQGAQRLHARGVRLTGGGLGIRGARLPRRGHDGFARRVAA